jgi:hypothetical protein
MKKHAVFLISLAAALILSAGNYYLFSSPPESTPIFSAAPVNTNLPDVIEGLVQTEGQTLRLDQLQTRPLFSPTRRPWIAPQLEPVDEPVPQVEIEPVIAEDVSRPAISLIGIQKTPLGAKALLLKSGMQDASWFQPGQNVEGWIVRSIDSDSVELINGTQAFKLELYPSANPEIDPNLPGQP